ncbi:hypothetical protein AGOR_G00029830 [Albula goreensis]|uniref:legumain n=1 Tax=Albula goreensis TaxID=1534307 RepID=A0A8T3E2T9_9TELE|nr:hypothetical protein AGOR_G00029830 [Albula goreensis]
MASTKRKQWILLAAGSRGWDKYRHQADVCHAYQMAKRNGIPDEQIIVMMYDDIAHNPRNPCQGNIINVPDGPNVYSGVQKDYTGDNVSAENFLAVLKGQKSSATQKVIESGSDDEIFVYLSDHGSTQMFAFPSSTLYASDLIDAVEDMSRKKQFSKMVIYMESCKSGSMLNHLPTDTNVYGVSASKPDENSHACFWDPSRETFLADVFSAKWMYNNETSNLERTTFQDQFNFLEREVTTSMPCQYGDERIKQARISEFWNQSPPQARAQKCEVKDAVPSRDVPLVVQENLMKNETDPQKKGKLKKRYENMKQTREKIDRAVQDIAARCPQSRLAGGRVTAGKRPTPLKELKHVAEHFRTACFNWHEEEMEYALSQMHILHNLCETGIDVASIKQAITHVGGKIRK